MNIRWVFIKINIENSFFINVLKSFAYICYSFFLQSILTFSNLIITDNMQKHVFLWKKGEIHYLLYVKKEKNEISVHTIWQHLHTISNRNKFTCTCTITQIWDNSNMKKPKWTTYTGICIICYMCIQYASEKA